MKSKNVTIQFKVNHREIEYITYLYIIDEDIIIRPSDSKVFDINDHMNEIYPPPHIEGMKVRSNSGVIPFEFLLDNTNLVVYYTYYIPTYSLYLALCF